jgi:cytoskeletal protein CcmA (bactofilin family)
MFNKAPERDGSPVNGSRPASQRGNSNSTSIIGADLRITGNLESKGEVQIDGQVEGDIRAQRIVVGEHARTTGNLVAESIKVRGNAQGSIRGTAVTFTSSGRVEADVFHKSLTIEQGAFFEGKSRRSDDPMSVQGPASIVLQPTRTP